MKLRNRKRLWLITLLVILSLAMYLTNELLRAAHYRTSFISGWFLLGMVVFLAVFGIRKKFSFLPSRIFPIGTAATWLQFHIYIGLLTAIIFLLHIGFSVPNGSIEIVLAVFYVGTFLSGVAGLTLSRFIPRRLTARGEEVLFERIPIFRKKIHEEVRDLCGINSTGSALSALIDLYENHLQHFLDGPRNVLWHLIFSSRPRYQLVKHLNGCRQFLSEEELPKVDQIANLIHKKDDLDYHYALQGILKIWLFVHIPLTYGLLIFAAFHAILVHSFT
ncbi:hypothetical protein OAF98_05075 [Planctomicrobium sp.]|jgi:hypothetical protein|nr:hypothetical protein [Planctomicrobium sp.]MDA7503409.1 hypothetical protein [bacterium]MDB4743839.1 hypothetical protein [Planctomicrobium sp.]